jgi:hypothetical protein
MIANPSATWQRLASCIRFLLLHSALCMAVWLLGGYIETQRKLPNEFAGLALVVAFYFGAISCGLAITAHAISYFKVSGAKKHWYAVSASLAMSGGVLLFFFVIAPLRWS